MKKIFTLFVLFTLVLGLNAQKKVIYFGLDKNMGASLAQIEQDPFLAALKADPSFTVDTIIFRVNYTNKKFYTNPDTVSFSNYDVIVVSESIGGGDSILSGRGLLGLEKLNKPTLYNKTYAFRNKRAFGMGKNVNPSLANGGSMGQETVSVAPDLLTSLKVVTGKESHDIFKNIPLGAGNLIQIFDTTAADAARVGGKAINYTVATNLSVANTLLASPNGTLTTGHVPVICINDIPGGTVLTDTLNKVSLTTAARVIMVGFNTGAIHSRNGTNLRPEGITLLKNAVYSLAGLAIPTVTAQLKSSQFTIAANGNQFNLRFGKIVNSSVNVYTLTGKLIYSKPVNADFSSVDLSGIASGIYIIKANGIAKKVMVK